MTQYTKPLPAVDADSMPFWQGTRQRKLMAQRCSSCGRYRWPARDFCNHCHTPGGDWVACSGRGTLVTWTVQHHVLHPAFAAEVPYAVVLVALEEDSTCRIVGNLRDARPEDLRLGMAMEPVFEDVAEDVTLVHWRPRR